METDTLRTLLAADDQAQREAPTAFDRERAVSRVREHVPVLESLPRRSAVVDVSAQDASFFADLLVRSETGTGYLDSR